MNSVASLFGRAVTAHREAAAHVEAARARILELSSGPTGSKQSDSDLQRWAARMQHLASGLTPGWLGA